MLKLSSRRDYLLPNRAHMDLRLSDFVREGRMIPDPSRGGTSEWRVCHHRAVQVSGVCMTSINVAVAVASPT